MKRVLYSHVIIGISLLLTACGFEPMAGSHTQSAQGMALPTEMASVRVEATSNQPNQRLLAQQFRAKLEDLINPGERLDTEKRYTLRVSLSPTISPGFIAPDGKAQRFIINMVTGYQLIRLVDNKVIEQGNLNRNSSYSNLPNAYFSTYVAEQDTTKRLAEELAADYHMKLASLLSSPPDEPSELEESRPPLPSIRPDSAITVPGIGR